MSDRMFETLAVECRRLFLRDHVVPVQIGAHDFEKGVTQRLVFNVELFVPYASTTPKADKLAEVVDYDFVREVIAARIAQGHVELQETLCDAVLNLAGDHPMEAKPWAGFSATTTLLRSDFGLGMFAPFVSDEVAVEISVEAVKAE